MISLITYPEDFRINFQHYFGVIFVGKLADYSLIPRAPVCVCVCVCVTRVKYFELNSVTLQIFRKHFVYRMLYTFCAKFVIRV